MKSGNMVIHPNSNMIRYQNKSFKAMVQPICLTCVWETSCETKVGTYQTQAVSSLTVLATISQPIRDRTPYKPQTLQHWNTINTTVIGDHETPHRVAMHISVSALKATVG